MASAQECVAVGSQDAPLELGPGALRDSQTTAERASLVTDARADVVAAREAPRRLLLLTRPSLQRFEARQYVISALLIANGCSTI